MVAQYGKQSQLSLDSLQGRIWRHYQQIAGPDAPQFAITMLQPPVFHGHALSIFIEMDGPIEQARLSQALSGDHVTIPSEEDSQPSNVSTAGQSNILLSVKPDAAQPNTAWLWAALDNLRIAALTAVECAESMIATRPVGKIQ
jgi:aspartate-semialdehyde dehydrogenase